MLTSNGLLGFLLANIVGFGGYQGDEFDTAFHKQITRILGECLAGARRQDLSDNLLNRRYRNKVSKC